MKVILLKSIKPHGNKDDVINVSDGFAKNYLFPNKIAKEATKQSLLELENKKVLREKKKRQDQENAYEVAKKLEKIVVKINSKAGETGKLFGSITAKDVQTALYEQFEISIDKKCFDVHEGIKNLGNSQIDVKLYPGVHATLNIEVISE